MKTGKSFSVVKKFRDRNKSSECRSRQLTRKRKRKNDHHS